MTPGDHKLVYSALKKENNNVIIAIILRNHSNHTASEQYHPQSYSRQKRDSADDQQRQHAQCKTVVMHSATDARRGAYMHGGGWLVELQ